MSIPSQVANAGNNSSAQNVFRITYSQALAAPPTLEAWDDSTFSTTNKEMFTGTITNGNKAYVSAVATTDSAPVSAWKPASGAAGGATINRLQGLVSFVNLSVAAPGAGGSVRFNLVWEIPSDAAVPSTNTLNGVLATRYAFSGATPTLTWQYNDVGNGGTEVSPQWTTITPGAAGSFIKPANTGSTSSSVFLTKPLSGTLDSPQVWVTAT
jgi:hypothetical protein